MHCDSFPTDPRLAARTYALASYLPGVLLDAILNVPHFLVSVRNALLPVQPHIILPQSAYVPPVPPPGPAPEAPALEQKQATRERAADSDPEQHDNASENGSEADVESNAGSGVGESWISVKDE